MNKSPEKSRPLETLQPRTFEATPLDGKAADDSIKRYTMTIEARVQRWCDTCARLRAVWVGETHGGDVLSGCGHCQRVLHRRRNY